ncbi:hypothetical protein M434DRAFT_291082 [Hypoxylon sp. CO27-5]|nr:hypothetical protein M434DRAFT_291082 [Hypoxylon sp. CO27-5]
MCRTCYQTTAASFSSSLAITNPELIWVHHMEQKQRASINHALSTQSQSKPDVKPSSASTYSESTTYSYDKDKSQSSPKQKRSMRQRIKEVFKDMGSPPASHHDRVNSHKTEEQVADHSPMSSTPQSRTPSCRPSYQ